MKSSLSERIQHNSARIEEAMHRYLGGERRPYEILMEAMRYSSYAGGKRIRPFLTLEVCRMLGGTVEAALPYACAVEMIHTYSLIHDDLPCMDNDDVRRGKPTSHIQFGEANALLAGDALLTYAFAVCAGNTEASAASNCRATQLLAASAGHDGMIGGQVLDLMSESAPLSRESFLLMNRLKTGKLIRVACLLGALAAGYDPESREGRAVEEFACRIGLAFQMEDDLLDEGTEDEKMTFLSYLSADEIRREISRLTDEAVARLASLPDPSVLCDFARYLATRLQ